jgi:hypothetical protein
MGIGVKRKMFRNRLLSVLLSLMAMSCAMQDEDAISIKTNTFDFNEGENGWKHGFSQYPTAGDSAEAELRYAYTDKPPSLPEGKGLMLSGKSSTPELFMFIKKQLTDLRPETDYTITVNVEVASSAASQSNNVVFPSVFLKVGAVSYEPQTFKTADKVLINVDKGAEDEDGSEMLNIGNIIGANSIDYNLALKSSSSKNPIPILARTDSNGSLWIIVGTDSNFQGTTTVFYSKVNVILTVTAK